MGVLGLEYQYWPTLLKSKISLSSQSQPIRWKWTSNPVRVSPARQYMYWDLEIIVRGNPIVFGPLPTNEVAGNR